MRLYLVEADQGDFDTFESGVVYANGPEDACEIVREQCSKPYPEAKGVWFTIERNQALTATPIERKRGAVHGYGRNG